MLEPYRESGNDISIIILKNHFAKEMYQGNIVINSFPRSLIINPRQFEKRMRRFRYCVILFSLIIFAFINPSHFEKKIYVLGSNMFPLIGSFPYINPQDVRCISLVFEARISAIPPAAPKFPLHFISILRLDFKIPACGA